MRSLGSFTTFRPEMPNITRPAPEYPGSTTTTLWIPGRQGVVMTREPRLLVPRMNPGIPCRIDWSNSISTGLLFFGYCAGGPGKSNYIWDAVSKKKINMSTSAHSGMTIGSKVGLCLEGTHYNNNYFLWESLLPVDVTALNSITIARVGCIAHYNAYDLQIGTSSVYGKVCCFQQDNLANFEFKLNVTTGGDQADRVYGGPGVSDPQTSVAWGVWDGATMGTYGDNKATKHREFAATGNIVADVGYERSIRQRTGNYVGGRCSAWAVWARPLGLSQRSSFYSNPYQFLIPA